MPNTFRLGLWGLDNDCLPPTCASYVVTIRNRFTGQVNNACSYSIGPAKLKFNRVLNDISEAVYTLTAPTGGDPCFECNPVEFVDELVIHRSDSDVAVWVGPIIRVVDDASIGSFTIIARDRLNLNGRRFSSRNFITKNPDGSTKLVGVIDLFRELFEDSNRLDPTGLILVDASGAGQTFIAPFTGKGKTYASQFKSFSERVLDFTVYGTFLLIGSPTINLPTLPTLSTLTSWQASSAIIDRDGSAIVSQVKVIGQGGTEAFWPPVAEVGPYGLHQLEFVDKSVAVPADALTIAKQIYEANRAGSTFVSTAGSSLSIEAPVCFHDLIPGARVPLHAQSLIYDRDEMQLLTNIVVEAEAGVDDGGGWALIERRIAIDLAPINTEGTAKSSSV